MNCPDCKDGFYYPFIGPPEPCQTCAGSITCPGPPADLATYEGDSSQDASFDRQCRTAFNDIVNKDDLRIYYSVEKLPVHHIDFWSTASRDRRISILIYNIKRFIKDEILIGNKAFAVEVNIQESLFTEYWSCNRRAWSTGAYLHLIIKGR